MPDNHSLILPGRKRDVTPDDVDLSAFLRVKILHEQDIGTSVCGVPVETFTRDGAQDDEVIEIAYEGGLKQWLSVGQLREDLARQKPGSVSADRVTIPADLGRPPVSRGLPDLMMKGMKFFVLNPSGAAADLAVARVVSRFEDQLVPSPGLYRLTDPQTVKDIVRRDTDLDTSGTLEPHLLAIFKKSRKKTTVDDAVLLENLADTLQHKQFQVERFVRVACPARGTLLASKRLDIYLSVMPNLIGLIPPKNELLVCVCEGNTA